MVFFLFSKALVVLVVLFVVSEGNPRHLTKRDVGYNFDCEYLYDDININLNGQYNRLIYTSRLGHHFQTGHETLL